MAKDLPVIQPNAEAPQESGNATAGMVSEPGRLAELKPKIVEALHKIYDPEIPVDIYELGLIYDIIVDANTVVGIRMTLTAPGCPAAQILPVQVREKMVSIPGVTDAKVDVVWDPPWDKDRMSDAAKLQLGLW